MQAKPNDSTRILPGFRHLPAHLEPGAQVDLLRAIEAVVAAAPLYRPTMPRTGRPFSVEMTNCGTLGWVSDRDSGYRYQPTHPETGKPWPPMPAVLNALWRDLAPHDAPPEACLVNYYRPGARLGSHVDADEEDKHAPVVSISLGADAIFHIGGRRRADPKARILLRSGDVVILGGEARLAYHGLDRTVPGTSDLVTGGGRINLTLRRVRRNS